MFPKRKFGLVPSFPNDLREGDLDPVSNENVSHLAYCFYYSIKNVTLEIVAKTDMFSLSERYGRALKATQEVSSYGYPGYTFPSSSFIYITMYLYMYNILQQL